MSLPVTGPADPARRADRRAAPAAFELHQRHQGDAGPLRAGGVMTQEVLVADHAIEYKYTRSTGPVIGAFLTALRDRRSVGVRTADGSVLVPPAEYDPVTSEDLSE